MKKITMICMAALLLLAASCKKEKEEINEPAGEESVFSVETEVHSGDSKTHLEGARVIWDSNDAIKVINGKEIPQVQVFSFSKYVDEGDKTVAEFSAENLPAGFYTPNYTGYYPSTIGNDGSFTMEQTQTYAAGSFASGVNPMKAVSNNKVLPFKNACGVLKLQLRSNEEVIVEKIIVRSKSEEKLWGNGSINSEGAFTVTNGGSNTIELDCSQADPEVILSPSKTTPTTFFIVLPVGTLSNGFEVEVIDKDSHGNWTVGTTKDNTIIRSRIRQMPVCTVKIGVQLYAGGPYWATCNLGATSPTRYGDYYAWAETEPYYTSLSWNDPTMPTVDNWKSGKENGYCWKSYPNNSATTSDNGFNEWDPVPFDGDNNLLPKYDAANQYAWEADEGTWYIPTASEFETMIAKTSHTYTSNYKGTGIAGRIYQGTTTGYTDRSIFLPCAGYFWNTTFYQGDDGYDEANYTTATRYYSATSTTYKAYRFHYYSNHKYHTWDGDGLRRYFGETIRPVKRN